MKLSELNFGKVENDAEFNWLGLTAEEYEGKKVLTFLNDEKYYKEIENNKSITCIVTTDEIVQKIKKDKSASHHNSDNRNYCDNNLYCNHFYVSSIH